MSYQVFLTDDAAYDLEVLYEYIETHDVPEKADYVLDKIEETFLSFADNPERGTYPNVEQSGSDENSTCLSDHNTQRRITLRS